MIKIEDNIEVASPKLCLIPDCDKLHFAKGFCELHYRRFRKTGDPLNFGSRSVIKGKDEIFRFHQKYEKQENGCWIWKGGTRANAKGTLYGRHALDDGTGTSSHRFSYSRFNGEIPKGVYVCHKCDTPLCVNPEHLFLGTHEDNMRDMVSKKRSYVGSGEDKAVSKLTNKQAEEIRNITHLSQSKIGLIYGVSQNTVSKIKRGIHYNVL